MKIEAFCLSAPIIWTADDWRFGVARSEFDEGQLRVALGIAAASAPPSKDAAIRAGRVRGVELTDASRDELQATPEKFAHVIPPMVSEVVVQEFLNLPATTAAAKAFVEWYGVP